MPTQTEMMKAVTAHHGIVWGSKSHKEVLREMKQKTGKTVIQEMYDALPGSAKSKVAETTTKKPEVKEGEILPPVKSTVETTNHYKTEVQAPNLVFNLTPPSVTVNANSASWAYTFKVAAQYAFVFASGGAFGFLGLLLKIKGI